MKKWYHEEYEFQIEVIGFLRGDHTEQYCRNGEEIGDTYTCTYGCPVNAAGQGICSKVMMILFSVMEAVRSGGDLENIGGNGKYRDEGGQTRLSGPVPGHGNAQSGMKFPR